MVTKRQLFLTGFGCRHREKVAVPVPNSIEAEPEGADDFYVKTHPSIYSVHFDLRYFPENWGLGESGQLLKGPEPSRGLPSGSQSVRTELSAVASKISNAGQNTVTPVLNNENPRLENVAVTSKGRTLSNPPNTSSHSIPSENLQSGISAELPSKTSHVESSVPPETRTAKTGSAIPDTLEKSRHLSNMKKLPSVEENPHEVVLTSNSVRPLEASQEFLDSTKKTGLQSARGVPTESSEGLDISKKDNHATLSPDRERGKRGKPKEPTLPTKRRSLTAEQENAGDIKRVKISLQHSSPANSGGSNLPSNEVAIERFKVSRRDNVVHFETYVLSILNALSEHGNKVTELSAIAAKHPKFVRKVRSLLKGSMGKSVSKTRQFGVETLKKGITHSEVSVARNESRHSEHSKPVETEDIDVNTLGEVWKRWNQQIADGSEPLSVPVLESMVVDSEKFAKLAEMLPVAKGSNAIPREIVLEHYLLLPTSTDCFHNLVFIASKEIGQSKMEPSKRLTATVRILSRVMSYISELAARVMEQARNDKGNRQDAFRTVSQEFYGRIVSKAGSKADRYLTTNVKKLHKVAKVGAQESDEPLRTQWSEISEKSSSAFRALKDIRTVAASRNSAQQATVDHPDARVAEVDNARPVPVLPKPKPIRSTEKNQPGTSKNSKSVTPKSPKSAAPATGPVVGKTLSRNGPQSKVVSLKSAKRSSSASVNPVVLSESNQSPSGKKIARKQQNPSTVRNASTEEQTRSLPSPISVGDKRQSPSSTLSPEIVRVNRQLPGSSKTGEGVLRPLFSSGSKLVGDKQQNVSAPKLNSNPKPGPSRRLEPSTQGGTKGGGSKSLKELRFDKQSESPKVLAQLRGIKPAADFTTLETIFMDSGKMKQSSLLNPTNEIQRAAVQERLDELTIGGVLKFYGMLCEFVGGVHESARRHVQTGRMPELPPPTTVVLPDVRELEERARVIEKNIRRDGN